MNKMLSFRIIGITLFITLSISYVVCILGDVLFGWTMYQVWEPMLPGFNWPVDAGGFLIGLLWLVGYSLYLAALIVLPYNFLIQRLEMAEYHQQS